MSSKQSITLILSLVFLVLSGCSTSETPPPSSTSTPITPTETAIPTLTVPILPTDTHIPPTPTLPEPTPSPYFEVDLSLHQLISQDQLFKYIQDLTAIQSYSGWRNSATVGEAEGMDYVAGVLEGFSYLGGLGMVLERQNFHVYLATEIWDSRLFLTIGGQEGEVPVNAISGHRELVDQALHFDSDGALNDSERNPVEVDGPVLLLRSVDQVLNLEPVETQGAIAFLDFAVIDPESAGLGVGAELITTLIQKGIAGLVVVTESGGGKYAGDGTILEGIETEKVIPMLYVRLEDLASMNISSWSDLARVDTARLIWDTDVFSPRQSSNLVALIPGLDSSQAVILGAHIDSANSPGAADNALNCAVLLELARILDERAVQPPVDIVLVWFGSEDLGYHGSQHFVNTHRDLLDRTLAAFMMDGFTADEPGPTIIGMQESSYVRFGNAELPFADYLSQKAQDYHIPIEVVVDSPIFASDDGAFHGFVPSVRFAFGSNEIGRAFHSPYDTLEIIRDQGEVMVDSVSMALITALDMPQDAPTLRVVPEAERRALILAIHTEPLHMGPSLLINLDRALAWEGFNVDAVPYGQFPTTDDLAEADLVIVLPVVDYPTTNNDPTLYDEAWKAEEIQMLVDYVAEGGFLVLTNSANRLFLGDAADLNEDWDKVNTLAAPFGVRYENDPFPVTSAPIFSDHPLAERMSGIRIIPNNGLPISLQSGEVLAEIAGKAVLVLVDYGDAGGQVLVLSDLGSFDLYDRRYHERDNFNFLWNLARYVRDR